MKALASVPGMAIIVDAPTLKDAKAFAATQLGEEGLEVCETSPRAMPDYQLHRQGRAISARKYGHKEWLQMMPK